MITPQEPQQKLAESLGVASLYFKREDLHPLHSHKGRSLPLMIDTYFEEGKRNFVISSSGNAAIAAGLHIQSKNAGLPPEEKITLTIFVGKKINDEKLAKLKEIAHSEHITISEVERPLQKLFISAQENGVQALRQSNDPHALTGYANLAQELIHIENLAAVFIPTSSGTTAEALLQEFKKLGKSIEVHIVQTASCHPLAEVFEGPYGSDEISIADAIVDQTALRKSSLIPLIEESGGSGHIITNEELEEAIELTYQQTGLELSPNSALSVAGLMKAMYTGKEIKGSIVCLITGK